MLTTRTKTGLARIAYLGLSAARRLGGHDGDVAEVTRRGVRWRLDLAEGIDLSIYLLGAFEPSTLRAYSKLVRPGDTVVDVGANIGAHTLHFARLVGADGRVVAVEPTDFAHAKLLDNLALNPALAERVSTAQALLVPEPGGARPDTLFSSWPLDGGDDVHLKLRGRAKTLAGARAVTLDALLEECAIERFDLLKIDVDGHETFVLGGARRALDRFRPRILMELMPWGLDEAGSSLEALLDLLHGAGYALGALGSGAPLPADAAALRASIPDGAGINALAVPR